jgi:hypothetical protein
MSNHSTPPEVLKLPDWAKKLSAVLMQYQQLQGSGKLEFDWETNNCSTFVDDCVSAMTSQQFYEPFKSVTTRLEAARKLKDLGFGSLEEYTDTCAPTRPSVVFAQRGDVVLLQGLSEDGLVVGLADPPFYWAMGEEGLTKGSLYPSSDSNVGVIKVYAIGRLG